MTETTETAHLRFRRERGLNEAEEFSRIWLATLGGLIVPLPNFRWRREILAQHDLHHLVTGYETTVCGELSLAAWELGVCCYSSFWARLLCFGLMFSGLLAQPRITTGAYRRGRQSATHYDQLNMIHRLETPLVDLREEFNNCCRI